MWIPSSSYNGLHNPSRGESWNIGIWKKGAFWVEPKEPVEKLIFCRLSKNARAFAQASEIPCGERIYAFPTVLALLI